MNSFFKGFRVVVFIVCIFFAIFLFSNKDIACVISGILVLIAGISVIKNPSKRKNIKKAVEQTKMGNKYY